MMQLAGMGLPQSCRNAAGLLKGSSRARAVESTAGEREARGEHKSYRAGLMRYMKAAETGVEVAQANAAYVLERGDAWYEGEEDDRLRRMLHYHGLAADQGNVKSLLQIGGAYYYGKGVDAPDKNNPGRCTSRRRSIEERAGDVQPRDDARTRRGPPEGSAPRETLLRHGSLHGSEGGGAGATGAVETRRARVVARERRAATRAREARVRCWRARRNATTADIAETVSLVFFGAALAIVLVARALATATARTKRVTRDERMARLSPTYRGRGFEPTRAPRERDDAR